MHERYYHGARNIENYWEESEIKREDIIMVNNKNKYNKRPKKRVGKGNGNEAARPKHIARALKPNEGITKKDICFYYSKIGHWKRNYPNYLKDKKNEVEWRLQVQVILL